MSFSISALRCIQRVAGSLHHLEATQSLARLSEAFSSLSMDMTRAPQASTLAFSRSFASGAAESSAGEPSTSAPASSVPKPDLVEQYLDIMHKSKGNRLRFERQEVMQEYQRHPGDCGSPEVMVALWTHRIRELAEHFKVHRKHLHEMRKLHAMLNKRRRMLMYMRRKDFPAYCYTIRKLGLRDIYTDVRKEDRYSVGSRHGDPPELHGNKRVTGYIFNFHKRFRSKKTTLWKQLKEKLPYEDPKVVVE